MRNAHTEAAPGCPRQDYRAASRPTVAANVYTAVRLLERLPDTTHYRIDGYGVYGCLPVNKHKVGKGDAVNGNKGLHSVLRGKLNRLARRTKRYSKTDGMPPLSLALAWLRLGWI